MTRHSITQAPIILFKGTSQYDVLTHFINELSRSFRNLGYQSVIIDLRSEKAIDQIRRYFSRPVFFALGLNAMGINLQSNGKSLYDLQNVPYFSFLVDHPMYHLDRLDTQVNQLIISCIDKYHVQFLQQIRGSQATLSFIPHGASAPIVPLVPFANREFEVVLAGTYVDPDFIRSNWKSIDPHLSRLLDDIAEQALYSTSIPMIEHARAVLEVRGLEYNTKFLQKLAPTLHYVDRFVRNFRRKAVIEALPNTRLHLFGNGWDKLELPRHAETHGPVTFGKLQQVMANTKIMLSILPNFQFGGHERIFTSMMAGAVCLTDSNTYMQNHFAPEKDLLYYDLSELDHLEESIHQHLQQTQKLEQIAEQGRQIVTDRHLWQHRAEEIIETAKFHYSFY